VPNIVSLGACFKIFFTSLMLARAYRQNWRYFRCPCWKTKSW